MLDLFPWIPVFFLRSPVSISIGLDFVKNRIRSISIWNIIRINISPKFNVSVQVSNQHFGCSCCWAQLWCIQYLFRHLEQKWFCASLNAHNIPNATDSLWIRDPPAIVQLRLNSWMCEFFFMCIAIPETRYRFHIHIVFPVLGNPFKKSCVYVYMYVWQQNCCELLRSTLS